MTPAEYRAKLGHTHLKVRDLDRSVAFYTRFFGLEVTEIVAERFAFLTGGDLHHELALQALGPDAPASPPGATGLYHVAFEVPNKTAFARAFHALTDEGIDVALVDHCISWAMYFDDPDGNGLEIYVDTRDEPEAVMIWRGINRPLNAATVLAHLNPVTPRPKTSEDD